MDDRRRLLGTTSLSFNKYCGVQEWKNCIFLWVNLGKHDGSPLNEFLDNGRQITWFGGSKMHEQSPAILSLIRHGRRRKRRRRKNETTGEEEEEEEECTSDVVLWCRRYQLETKAFTPYMCFGRMGYLSHDPGSRPLAFVWALLDYDGLKFHPDPAVRGMFELFSTRL